MSAVEEFGNILRELPTLKAPGVSGTRIKKLTDLAVKNVADESQFITVLYTSCKATPSSHKLGVLYVVDSIVRVYMDEAKKKNEVISLQAPEGTFAAGVFKISELVESIIDDAMELLIVPATNVKIGKLVDIWERAQTFSPEIIERIRAKHFRSPTPPGTPPGVVAAAVPPPAAAADSASILLALSSLAKKTETPTPPVMASPAAQNAVPANNATNILSQLSQLAGAGAGALPSPPAPAPQQPNKELIFNMLQQMQTGPPASVPQIPQVGSNIHPSRQGYQTGQFDRGQYDERQHDGGNQYNDRRGRDDVGGYSRRNRSRSPGGRYGRYDQHQNQNQNQYGQNQYGQNQFGQNQYGHNQFGQDFHGGHGGHGGPPGGHEDKKSLSQGFSPSEGEQNVPGAPHYRPRNVGVDNTLPQGSFKVLSRTLFIGGVPRGMDERQLASHLRPYAEVQSVIMNSERKHAFVKVYSRKEAEQVVQSFNKDGALPLRTRWGVGFGPRDCCNYQHGISIIPIQRLTDADRSWVVLAQWGGTGGQPLVTGMVIDEPDIEIGTGISSKAMSKKMPTNSARNGPKSNRPGESDEQYVKTSNGQQDFMSYGNGAANPLSGLFNQQQQQPPQAFGGMPPQNAYPPNFGGQNNGNLSAQLANFFQNGGQQH